MALFPWSKNKTPALPGPSAELPWTLTVGVDPGTCSDPTWQQVEEGLYGLNQEQDSFLILEQQDPQNPDAYWFIQCAVARMGPDQGRYSVEVGFPGAGAENCGCIWCPTPDRQRPISPPLISTGRSTSPVLRKRNSDPRAADRRKQNGTQQTSSGLGGV